MALLDTIKERSVLHINYNHPYYFWHVYKEGPVVGATEALFLTSQMTTGQIRALEKRLQGRLFKRKGRGLEPSELDGLVFRYADRMFTLSQEMFDIVSYHKESNLLFNVGIAGALSKRLVSGVLDAAVVESEQIHPHCFESAHELLLGRLSQRKPDTIISDRPIDLTQQEELSSVKIGEYSVSLWCISPVPTKPLPAYLGERRLLTPGRHSMLGCKLLNWINVQGLEMEIFGEFDDAALMKAFGAAHNAIFVVPILYAHNFHYDESTIEIGYMDSAMEKCHAIFAE